MKAPKCRICGVSEWQHVCGGGVPVERVTELVRPERKKTVTKKNKVTKNKVTKRGRPKLGEVSLTAAEKMRRYREKKKGEASE